jgi:hypothetical protein
VFCGRGFIAPLADAMFQETFAAQMQADIDWLMMTHSEEML